MAIIHACSFDAKVPLGTTPGGGGATTALTNRKYWDAAGATAPSLETTTVLHGTTSAKWAAAAAGGGQLSHTVGGTTATIGGWVRRGTGSQSSTTTYMRFLAGVTNFDCRLNSDGVLYLTTGAIDGTELALHTPAADTWYWLTLSVDVSANPNTATAKVYSAALVLLGNRTRNVAVAADTLTTAQVGFTAAGHNFDLFIDSYVVSDAATPLLPRKVQALAVSGNGTHSFTDNDFTNQVPANLTTASDIAALVDEFPPSLTDFVQQAVIRTTGYVEFAFADLDTTGLDAAGFVQLCIASHPVSTANANTSIMRLVDGGTVTAEALADMTVTADTLEYHKHGYSVAPSTSGAWSNLLVNALKARWGFSDDVTPHPALDAIWLEVSSPITMPATSSSGPKARGRMAMSLGMGV